MERRMRARAIRDQRRGDDIVDGVAESLAIVEPAEYFTFYIVGLHLSALIHTPAR